MFESTTKLAELMDDASSPASSSLRNRRPTIAVVGAGATGALVALHLTRRPDAPDVRLFERGPDVGRGVAYGAAGPGCLLNARAGSMSAFQDRPDHFTRWLARVGAPYGRDDFAPRPLYGAYLGDLLRRTMDKPGRSELIIDHDEVVAALPASGGWRLTTRSGRRLSVDGLVLASGLAPPEPPPGLEPDLAASPRYVADPWDGRSRLADLGERVLLVGAGLTMVDAALTLADGRRRITAVSRRGLLPQPHAGAPIPPIEPLIARDSPGALLRQVRRAAEGADWRAIVDGYRPQVQEIWASWSAAQRASFLRHARCWWDVRRHRAAPEAAGRIAEFLADGALTVRPARLRSLALGPQGVLATWVARGSSELEVESFDAVVNCTGRGADPRRSPDTLMRQLLAAGLVRPDPSGLGLETDEACRPLALAGGPTSGFYAAGPLTQGRLWEITAIPEIRVQAERLASAIVGATTAA